MRTGISRETAATVTGKIRTQSNAAECRGCEHHGIRARGDQKDETAGREGDAGEDRGIFVATIEADGYRCPAGAQPSPERRADRSGSRSRRSGRQSPGELRQPSSKRHLGAAIEPDQHSEERDSRHRCRRRQPRIGPDRIGIAYQRENGHGRSSAQQGESHERRAHRPEAHGRGHDKGPPCGSDSPRQIQHAERGGGAVRSSTGYEQVGGRNDAAHTDACRESARDACCVGAGGDGQQTCAHRGVAERQRSSIAYSRDEQAGERTGAQAPRKLRCEEGTGC